MKISFLLLSAFVLGNACYKVTQEEKMAIGVGR